LTPLTFFAAAVVALWLGLALRLAALRRRAPPLPLPVGLVPPTTILLPVRDEEENLAACAESLLAQLGEPGLRIIDDGSTDRTAEILSGLVRRHPRATACEARELPAGWTGKVNALATGFQGTETDWILLTDADTRHAPELLARAHAAASEHRLDALSLTGRQVTASPGEGLLTPAVYALLDLMLGDWRPYARGEGEPPIANGQYFLLKADALRAIGGFAAIAGQPLDDVALAAALHGAGFKVGFRRAGAALQVRMYKGLRATIRGWRRNLALFVAARPAVTLGAILLPLATLGVLLLTLGLRRPSLLVTCWLGGVVASALARRSAGHGPLTGALFPVDALLLSGTLACAVVDRLRGRATAWRGREIQIRK
jgi:cellulose synthase/poly-beta-1,6-N-acetylglucosamine synthase-like glycosyltransferase